MNFAQCLKKTLLVKALLTCTLNIPTLHPTQKKKKKMCILYACITFPHLDHSLHSKLNVG